MTEARAQEVLNEVTIGLDKAERFLRVQDQVMFGVAMIADQDPKTKHHYFRVRRSWLEVADEPEFRFAAATTLIISERMARKSRTLTTQLLAFVGIAPILGLVFAGSNIPADYRLPGWIVSLVWFVGFCWLSVYLGQKEFKDLGYVEALHYTRDYDAARRFLLDERTHEGSRFKPKPKHIENMLRQLDAAADELGLRMTGSDRP